ncbi:MAG: galactokinase [Pseudomonadota bacterium]
MVITAFEDRFGEVPTAVATAPGRVNLIGEHIDYNGGMVLPMALPVGLTVAISPRPDDRVLIASERFDSVENFRLGDAKKGHWADYALGAVALANQTGLFAGGLNLLVSSTIPDGAGLSSSAALIVAILKAVRDQAASKISDVEIALLAQRVEHEFIGMPCGIMDQMAVAVGQPDQALALDTITLEFSLVPLPDQFHFAVVHSGQHRKLSDGRYRERTQECHQAKEAAGGRDLCSLSEADVADLSVPDDVKRRARHCVTEHRRVLATVDALKQDNLMLVGRLMSESHASMRNDFEMSTPEIDALVHDAIEFGALGSRLTGGGFGGCLVSLVPTEVLDGWCDKLRSSHSQAWFVC